MPPKQMNTRMIKEALRYKFELGPSLERTAMALKISKGVLAKYVGLSKAAGLDWSQIEAMTEAQLQARLLPGRLADGGNGHYVQPDYAAIHLELKRKGMTLMLLWQEHRADNPEGRTYQYSQYCEHYRRWTKTLHAPDPARWRETICGLCRTHARSERWQSGTHFRGRARCVGLHLRTGHARPEDHSLD